MKKYFVLLMFFLSALCLFHASAGFGKDLTIKMATTTSTDNTGLLDYLAPEIKKDTGINLQWVAVGTGRAIKLGENCDVDVLLVHDPAAELQYMKDGYGINRRQIMYNDFILLGPAKDPAGLRNKSIGKAFQLIAKNMSLFASRGDRSGTHEKEIALWKDAGLSVPEKESWYIQTGQGMLDTLNIAAERDAYTLADRATYIKYESIWKGKPPLVVLSEGGKTLRNQYSIIPVNPEKCGNAKSDLAEKLSLWMVSGKAQKLIGGFKIMDKQLYIPNAGK